MKVVCPDSCGNSPKGQLVKELTIALAFYQLENVRPWIAEEFTWTLVGDKPVIGRDNFIHELQLMAENPAVALEIFSIVTHGKQAAVQGKVKMKDGSEIGFGDFYTFTSASGKKVLRIESFISSLTKKS